MPLARYTGRLFVNTPYINHSSVPIVNKAYIDNEMLCVSFVRMVLTACGKKEKVVQAAAISPTRVIRDNAKNLSQDTPNTSNLWTIGELMRVINIWIMDVHPLVRLLDGFPAKLFIQLMRIPRQQYPSSQSFQVRMGHHLRHQPFG